VPAASERKLCNCKNYVLHFICPSGPSEKFVHYTDQRSVTKGSLKEPELDAPPSLELHVPQTGPAGRRGAAGA
jgi:hypothetical protein